MRDIYDFMSALFLKAHLSSECSVVCLIYVERLMEKAHVPFDDRTWRPVLLCSMLLASKVWQGLRLVERRIFRRLPPVRAGGAESPGAGLRHADRLGHVHLPVALREVLLRFAVFERKAGLSAALQPVCAG